jgi:YidC/Oxa1 family membrane protein insertase
VNEQRNLIMAVVLSALVLIGWTFLSERYVPVANPPSTKIEKGKSVALPQPGADPAADSPTSIRRRAEVLRESPRVLIETPRIRGSLNLKGARIDDLVLTDHRETLAKDSPPIRLLSPAGSRDAYFAGLGWTGQGLALPSADTVWTANNNRLIPGQPVTLSWDNGQGQTFAIRIAVDSNYMFTIDQQVENRGTGVVAVRPYSLVSRVGPSKDPDSWTMHTGPVGWLADDEHFINFSKVDEAPQPFTTTGGWLGFTDKYWLAAIIPGQDHAVEATFRKGSNRSYQADFLAPVEMVAAGKSAAYQSRLFAGAKEVQLLDAYEEQGVEQLDLALDWGWFWFFEKPIFKLLQWLFHLIGNFGVAIMCLTLIVRLIMFPIAQKQFASFAKMRVIQPKMKALQERYKDDKQRMQQEMLKLYKDEKANPAAGCLPILIQIPIFYALYKVLMISTEMRHQPFALWIKDLSAPDPLTPINLFGLLPFTPPSIIAVGVLPIIVGITMWMQFKLNPQPMDPVQKQMFAIMPWVLTIVMAPFAAGLQLYWATSNILTIAQQKWLYSRHPALKEAPEAK